MTPAQREAIARTIDAWCARTGRDRSTLSPADAPTVASDMGIAIYPLVQDAIAAVLGG